MLLRYCLLGLLAGGNAGWAAAPDTLRPDTAAGAAAVNIFTLEAQQTVLRSQLERKQRQQDSLRQELTVLDWEADAPARRWEDGLGMEADPKKNAPSGAAHPGPENERQRQAIQRELAKYKQDIAGLEERLRSNQALIQLQLKGRKK